MTYNETNYTGTLAAASAQVGAFYLVKSSTAVETLDVYDEYAVITSGSTKSWEKIGDTQLDLSSLGDLAYKDTVTVTFTGNSTDTAIGTNSTFTVTQPTITVTPTTTNIKATASGAEVGANGTDTFVKSYPGATQKLATTTVPNVTGNSDVTIPNVTGVGSAST